MDKPSSNNQLIHNIFPRIPFLIKSDHVFRKYTLFLPQLNKIIVYDTKNKVQLIQSHEGVLIDCPVGLDDS